MVNLNGVVMAPHETDKTLVVLTRKCPCCGKEHSITVKADDLEAASYKYERSPRALVQDVLPTWTPSEREFLMTGICDECWESM